MINRSGHSSRQWLVPLLMVAALCLAAPAVAGDTNRWDKIAVPLFEHISPEAGLPHPIVMSIAQDGDGFVWFGTQRGLARWDGYRMRNFQFDAADPNSLPADFVGTLHTDRTGRLWVGTTTGGLAMYDRARERFIRYKAGPDGLSAPTVTAIASDAKGGIWVGTPSGLNYVDANGAIERHPRTTGTPGAARHNQIRALLVDRNGKLWIGSAGGLARRDGRAGTTVDIPASDGTPDDAVLALAENERGQIAFGTLKSGIGVVDTIAGTRRIMSLTNVPDAASTMVLAVAHIAPGRWWATTYGGGIIEFDPDSGSNRRIGHRPAIPSSFGHNRAAALLRDRSGLVWVSHERGIDFYNPYNRAIDTVFDGEGLLEIGATAFMRDTAGRVWIGMADQGIDIVDGDGNRSAALRPDSGNPDKALPNRVILAIEEADDQEAWIGTQLGLYRTSAHGKQVSRIALPLANPYPRVGPILRHKGVLWLGTDDGLLRYDPQAGTVQAIVQGPAGGNAISNNRISALLPEPDGRIWIGTRNGLNLLDPATGKVEQFSAAPNVAGSLPDALVAALSHDAKGRLWVATYSGGISVLDKRAAGAPVFRHIGAAQGLPAMPVSALSPEYKGKIWASTANGIVAIDTASLQVRAYGRADGLALPSYFTGVLLHTPDAGLLMGGPGGLTVLHLDRFSSWAFRPALVVSTVRLDGRALPGAQQLAASGATLTVPAGTGSIEIETASLDFSASPRNRYAFWLEGQDQGWVETEAGRRLASYGNLAPGQYRLHMRGSNRDGTWSSNELSMAIHVLPAWHQSWWARVLYVLAAGVLASGLYHWRVRQLRLTQARLQALVASRTAHLEKLHAIVKSINEQLDFGMLLDKILQEAALIRGIHAAAAWVRVDGTDLLELHTATAAGERASMTLSQAEARFVAAATVVGDDIFLTRAGGAVLAVRICFADQVQGYLVFENRDPAGTIDGDDLDLFKALKEPFVSAFQKAHAVRQIEQARINAETATRAKSDFLANISHEIRTPMNAIMGFAGLGTHLEVPLQATDYFRKIGRAGQSLLGIINDVLDFSKIEAGKLELEAVPFDLPDTLNQIADMFAWRAAEKGLELVVWAAPDVPANLVGDPLRLSQILINLVGNALKFTSKGFIQLRVALAEPDPDAPPAARQVRLRFSVEDSGVGVSQEQLARLFQAFVQADASTTRMYGGTGLGLVISQQLVSKMGGRIDVASTPGEGSRFSFTVNLQQQDASATLLWEAPQEVLGKTILVVDDSAPTREVLLLQLRSFGFDASAVGSGAAALLALQLQPHDLVLMDWNMPDMDGIEATRQIKNDPLLPTVPMVIMVTAFDRDHIKQAASDAGVDAFLVKPVNPSQLLYSVLAAFGIDTGQPAAPAAPAPSAAALRIRGARLLVVDDNAINQQVASEILQRAGVQVDLADSGVDAVRMINQSTYDAVLMDIQMPDMDGYQATALVREKTQHAKLPIIAMTAHAVAGYREHCLAKGMNDYVSKPIDPDMLYQVLGNWVQGDAANAGAAARPMADVAPADMAPAAAGMAGIDIEGALARLGGNMALLERLLVIFAEDFGASSRQIHAAVSAGQFDQAAMLVHRIRGAAGNLSANDLYRSAGELEKALASPGSVQLDKMLNAFASDFDLVIDTARAAMA